MRWGADDDLLPDSAPVGVLQVVDLIQHCDAELGHVRRRGVHHVAQYFGGHDHHVGAGPDDVVAGEQPHSISAQPRSQVAQLLVRQGFGGSRVGSSLAGLEGPRYRVFRHQRLAPRCRSRDQHRTLALDRLERLDLEAVRRDAARRHMVRQQRRQRGRDAVVNTERRLALGVRLAHEPESATLVISFWGSGWGSSGGSWLRRRRRRNGPAPPRRRSIRKPTKIDSS